MVERVRQLDYMGGWTFSTLSKYGPYLRHLRRFSVQYGVNVLQVPPLLRPPVTPAIPLAWAEELYSLRTTQGKDRQYHRVSYNTVRQLRSAAAWYHTQALNMCYPGRVLRDKFRRGHVMPFVSPTDEALTTLTAYGMAKRLGTEATKSWALSHVHIAYMDREFESRYRSAPNLLTQHEIACAATVSLAAYLGWFRGGEVFSLGPADVVRTAPAEGPTRGLPPGIGAVEISLLAATKSDPTVTADVVIAHDCLSGLSLGRWLARLRRFTPQLPGVLFSTAAMPVWTSRYFRERYAWPILEQQRRSGEPTLATFSDTPGHRICDKVSSFHSWRRGGRSRVSRPPRHYEPNPPGTRKATPEEVYEHGRWAVAASGESMPRRYNQWDLADRIGITLFCM